MEQNLKKIECPHCGYEMPILYEPKTAEASGMFVRCKGRRCGRFFEIKLPKPK